MKRLFSNLILFGVCIAFILSCEGSLSERDSNLEIQNISSAENNFSVNYYRSSYRELHKFYKNLLLTGGFYDAITKLSSTKFTFCDTDDCKTKITKKSVKVNINDLEKDKWKSRIQILEMMSDIVLEKVYPSNLEFMFKNSSNYNDGLLSAIKSKILCKYFLMGYLLKNLEFEGLRDAQHAIQYYQTNIKRNTSTEENLLGIGDFEINKIMLFGASDDIAYKNLRKAINNFKYHIQTTHNEYGLKTSEFSSSIDKAYKVDKNIQHKFPKNTEYSFTACYEYFKKIYTFCSSMNKGNEAWKSLMKVVSDNECVKDENYELLKINSIHRVTSECLEDFCNYKITTKYDGKEFSHEMQASIFKCNVSALEDEYYSDSGVKLHNLIWLQANHIFNYSNSKGLQSSLLDQLTFTGLKNTEVLVNTIFTSGVHIKTIIKANSPEGLAFLGTPIGSCATNLAIQHYDEFQRIPQEIIFTLDEISIIYGKAL